MSAPTMRLQLQGVAKAYAAPVLRNVSLDLCAGEVHALLGENGAGKTTLGKIICGQVKPDSGHLRLDGEVLEPKNKRDAELLGLRMVRQELGIIGTLSVAENIFLNELHEFTRWRMLSRRKLGEHARKYLRLVGLDDVDPACAAGALGIGQQQAVEIAAALTRPCRVLVLDEPTASLGAPEVDRLFERIKVMASEGTTVVYVSHRMEEIKRVCDRASVLRDGDLVATGDPRAMDPQEAVRLMIGRPLRTLAHFQSARSAPRAGLRVEGLAVGHVRHVSFVARKGEILGLAGLVGAGRTETLRAVFGADPRLAGEIFVGDTTLPVKIRNTTDATRAGMVFLSEDRKTSGLLLPKSIKDNLALGPLSRWVGATSSSSGLWRWVTKDVGHAQAANALEQLRIRCTALTQTIAELSGGNQQKVLMGRALLMNPSILLLDEPTRGVDVGARWEIYGHLRDLAKQDKTLVVASSDIHELMALCDRIAVMAHGALVATFERHEFDETRILSTALTPPRP